MMTRRETLGLFAAGSVAVLLPACGSAADGPVEGTRSPQLAPDRRWLSLLGQSLAQEFDYTATVEGVLPPGLTGTLYRNGPGLFEREGFRKRTVLDGDGMIRAVSFQGGVARFRNRFVRTAKFTKEEARGRFLYPTWTTPAPSLLDNIPGMPALSQAGVTPVLKQGRLLAFDEMGKPYELDPMTLETRGELEVCDSARPAHPRSYKAHTKTDGATGVWVLAGTSGGRNPDFQMLLKDRNGRQLVHLSVPNPSSHYLYNHDFFWAGRYAVFHLHPAVLSPLPMLLGARTFADSLSWKPELGGQLLIIDTVGGAALTVEVPAVWMWHSVNAYQSGTCIVADFVGYDAPDHFFGPGAAFRTVMQGLEAAPCSPGQLRRFIIDVPGKTARLETVASGHFEFPSINPGRVGHRHRYAFVASGDIANGWFHDGVARIDVESGVRQEFRFGPAHYVGEPVFAADETLAPGRDPERAGWLLCEVLDGASKTSFIAVFDAASINDGPVARLRLNHHLPFSFHGWWKPA